jgi:hypothetical protein
MNNYPLRVILAVLIGESSENPKLPLQRNGFCGGQSVHGRIGV